MFCCKACYKVPCCIPSTVLNALCAQAQGVVSVDWYGSLFEPTMCLTELPSMHGRPYAHGGSSHPPVVFQNGAEEGGRWAGLRGVALDLNYDHGRSLAWHQNTTETRLRMTATSELYPKRSSVAHTRPRCSHKVALGISGSRKPFYTSSWLLSNLSFSFPDLHNFHLSLLFTVTHSGYFIRQQCWSLVSFQFTNL